MAKSPTKTSTRSKTTKTRARATATRKTSTSLRDVAEAAPTKEGDVAKNVTAEIETAAGNLLRKKELIEAAVERAGVKKRDAKPAIEAALSILGESIAKGQGVNIPELGKIKVQNSKELEGVKVMNLRMRRKLSDGATETAETDSEGLAEAAE